MTYYVYPPMVALDANGDVLRSGSGRIYAETDTTGSTPLAIEDLNGTAITEVLIGALGITQAFRIDGYPEVVWRSGDFAVPLSSPRGMREAAEAAASSAAAAALVAAAAAAIVDSGATSDATTWSSNKISSEIATRAPVVHTHAGEDITSGLIAPARLGTGLSIGTKFLRGDGTWQAAGGGGGSVSSVNGVTPDSGGDITLAASDVGAQAADSDLAALAGIAPSNDDFIQRKSGVWVNRTIAQIKTDLGISNVNNTSDANKPVSDATATALNGKLDKSTLAAKGDLYVATASGTVTRLAVGSNGQVLTADSAQSGGVKWAAGASGYNSIVKKTAAAPQSFSAVAGLIVVQVILGTTEINEGTDLTPGTNIITVNTTGIYELIGYVNFTTGGAAGDRGVVVAKRVGASVDINHDPWLAKQENTSRTTNVEQTGAWGCHNILPLTAGTVLYMQCWHHGASGTQSFTIGESGNYAGETQDYETPPYLIVRRIG